MKTAPAFLRGRASHTGALRCLAATLNLSLMLKMADSRELQTNLTEYRAQLRQVSFFRSELREFVRFQCEFFFD